MARSKVIEGLKAAVRHARGDKSQSTTYVVMVDESLDGSERTGAARGARRKRPAKSSAASQPKLARPTLRIVK